MTTVKCCRSSRFYYNSLPKGTGEHNSITMELSKEKRLAILHALIVMASADGSKGSLENRLLSDVTSKILNFSLQDFLNGIVEEASFMPEEKVGMFIKELPETYRLKVHQLLIEMATVDKPINEMELKVLYYMINMYNLPHLT